MGLIRRPARMEFLHELLEFIDAGAKESGFGEDSRGRIRLAAEEALVNVILHAYPDSGGDIETALSGEKGRALDIEIRDWGAAFDPMSVSAPDLSGDVGDRKVGGLGIFFIREVTDRVAYRRDGERNTLTLTFLNP